MSSPKATYSSAGQEGPFLRLQREEFVFQLEDFPALPSAQIAENRRRHPYEDYPLLLESIRVRRQAQQECNLERKMVKSSTPPPSSNGGAPEIPPSVPEPVPATVEECAASLEVITEQEAIDCEEAIAAGEAMMQTPESVLQLSPERPVREPRYEANIPTSNHFAGLKEERPVKRKRVQTAAPESSHRRKSG